MKYKFQYYRFLLSPMGLLSQLPDSRQNSFQEIFEIDSTCEYMGTKYSLKFITRIDDYIHFKIAKHTLIERNKSPEEGFELEQMDHWPNLNIFIYTGDKLDKNYGQVIAVQCDKSILNNPLNVLRSWADSRNKRIYEYGHVLSINPISTQESFWQLVDKYQGKIEKLIFEYSMPNLFNLNTALEDDLKAANKDYNASKAAIVLSNELGSLNIPKNNPLINQTNDYIDKGGGEFKLKIKGETSYRISAKKVKTKDFELEDLDIITEDKNTFLEALKTVIKGAE